MPDSHSALLGGSRRVGFFLVICLRTSNTTIGTGRQFWVGISLQSLGSFPYAPFPVGQACQRYLDGKGTNVLFLQGSLNPPRWRGGLSERSGLHVEGVVVGHDLATAILGLVNAGYFGGYWWRRNGSRGRRVAAAALALVSAAAVVEALCSEWLFWSQQGLGTLGQVSPGAWAVVRLPLLLATAFISLLIVRRLRA